MNTVDWKRISIFIFFAFGLSWLIALVIYLTGGLVDSPELIPNTGLTLGFLLLLVVMWTPAAANLLTRRVTREGWTNLWLRPQPKREWRYWLLVWLGTIGLTALGAAVYFLIFPSDFSTSFAFMQEQLDAVAAETGQALPMPVGVLALVQIAAAITVAPLINSLFTFGEEFGWRAYLQQKLWPLGGRKALLLMGFIWGAWHWPIIAMGHNFGLDYPGYPWLGMLLMVWFTTVVGIFFGWATWRAGSVWPAVLGHAVINAVAGTPALFLAEAPNPLLGPLPVGIIGSVGFALAAAWLLRRPLLNERAAIAQPGDPVVSVP